MSITIVNDWRFRPGGNVEAALNEAQDLVDHYVRDNVGNEMSLWVNDQGEPTHYFHFSTFESYDSYLNDRNSTLVDKFIKQAFPYIVRDESFRAPECEVVLCSDGNVPEIRFGTETTPGELVILAEWRFASNGNIEYGMNLASGLVNYFITKEKENVRLSLWLQNRGEPLHFFHLLIFKDRESEERIREGVRLREFMKDFYPEIQGGSDGIRWFIGEIVISRSVIINHRLLERPKQ